MTDNSPPIQAWLSEQVAEAYFRRQERYAIHTERKDDADNNTGRKKRGRRPKKQLPFVSVVDYPMSKKRTLMKGIVFQLRGHHVRMDGIRMLADAAVGFMAFKNVRENAPLVVKRRGNRPNIHLAMLLCDCALVAEMATGNSALTELKRIGERTENNSTVISYARAVLTSLRVKHPHSLRQQARQAIKYL